MSKKLESRISAGGIINLIEIERTPKIKNRFPEKIQHTDSALIYKIHDINTVRYSG